jgi:hypothetical protein
MLRVHGFAPNASQCVGPITCSKGSIIEISLWGVARSSRGRVASQIGLLTGLQGLTIGYMNLQGTIPVKLGDSRCCGNLVCGSTSSPAFCRLS